MSELRPETYSVPLLSRIRAVPVLFGVAAVGILAALVGVVYHEIGTGCADPLHVILTYGFGGGSLLWMVWVLVYGWRSETITYRVWGLRFEFQDPDYFVPRETMARFVEDHLENFKPILDEPVQDVLSGARVVVEDAEGALHGVSRNAIEVAGPDVLRPDETGEYLRELVVRRTFPHLDERQRKNWRDRHKI